MPQAQARFADRNSVTSNARVNMFNKLLSKLKKSREYRAGYVAAQTDVLIPFQIRALRKQYGLEQKDLAELTGMKQPTISRLEKAGTRANIETLMRIADGLDVALIVKFVPFSELVRWSDNFSPDSFTVPSFNAELERAETLGVRNVYPINGFSVVPASLSISGESTARFTDQQVEDQLLLNIPTDKKLSAYKRTAQTTL